MEGVGGADCEEAEVGPASLDDGTDATTGVRLASAEENVHLVFAHSHVIGEGAGVEADVGEAVTTLVPVVHRVEVGH